jgi:hypothetical protein
VLKRQSLDVRHEPLEMAVAVSQKTCCRAQRGWWALRGEVADGSKVKDVIVAAAVFYLYTFTLPPLQ